MSGVAIVAPTSGEMPPSVERAWHRPVVDAASWASIRQVKTVPLSILGGASPDGVADDDELKDIRQRLVWHLLAAARFTRLRLGGDEVVLRPGTLLTINPSALGGNDELRVVLGSCRTDGVANVFVVSDRPRPGSTLAIDLDGPDGALTVLTHQVRSVDLTCRHRLGFALKRPKKRLLKADPARREAFVAEYVALTAAARRTGAKIFFADEAHFQADADLRGKWVLKGEPALVDSTSPRRGEKVSYYSAVCLETGEVEVMELEGNSNSETSAAFLRQLRAGHPEPLTLIWDNSPAHRGDAIRAYLTTPGLHLRLVNLPSYSPDFNADEAIWGWARAEATANSCLGTRAAVREKVGGFFTDLSPAGKKSSGVVGPSFRLAPQNSLAPSIPVFPPQPM